MNWRKQSPWLMSGQNGFKVAKFMVGDQAKYRASKAGEFITPALESFADAEKACENYVETVDVWSVDNG